jgi:hypothetical protein
VSRGGARLVWARVAMALWLLASAAVTRGDSGAMQLRDLAGSGGQWQEGEAIVAAPPAQVQAWLTDYTHWPERFPDVATSQVLGRDARGRNVVRFYSRIAERMITVREAVAPGLLVFDGWGGDSIFTQGRIYLLDAGAGRTRVIMQSTSQVHGILAMFATHGLKRRRAFQVIESHLAALIALGRQQ